MDKYYTEAPQVWKTPGNPDKIAVLSPISVDNCVENVDFCISHAVYIQAGAYLSLIHI